MSRGNKVRALVTTGILSTAAAMATGCTSINEGTYDNDEEVYCVDENNKVVDDDRCDDNNGGGGGGFFFIVSNFGGSSFTSGQRIPNNYVSRGKRFSVRDTQARTRAGLPATGRVSSGTRISGGIGTGTVGRVGTAGS